MILKMSGELYTTIRKIADENNMSTQALVRSVLEGWVRNRQRCEEARGTEPHEESVKFSKARKDPRQV